MALTASLAGAPRQRRLLLEWLAILVLAIAVVAGLARGGLTRRFDNLLYDQLVGLRRVAPDPRILIVGIDDDSLARIGRWPWPRERHAELVDRLRAAHARAVAFDVLFTEPTAGDAALGRAMAAGPRTFMPLLFSAPGLNGAAYDLVPPVAPVARAAAGIGHVNVTPDEDGTVRSIALGAGHPAVPHLMEQVYRAVAGHPSAAFARAGDAPLLVPFTRGAGSFAQVPFAAVLAGEVPAGFLKDRIVLVGATAPGLGDAYPTPISGGTVLPGVELQANVLSALLAGAGIVTLPLAGFTLLSLVPLMVLMAGFWRWSPAVSLRVSVALVLACLVGAPGALLALGVWVPPGPAIAGLLLVYPLWGWRRLQALSDDVGAEVARLRAEPGLALPSRRGAGARDMVAVQAAELAEAIDRMRDLRRFVGDVIRELPDPLLVADEAGRITLANAAAQALLGREDTLAALPPVREDGTVDLAGRTFILGRAPLHDADDRAYGTLVRLADISALREAARAREAMLAFLSHDMRSPQASILALLEQHGAPAVRADLAERIGGFARRTLVLAENFVQLARLGATPFAPEPLDLAGLVQEACDELWAQARARDVRIVADLPEDDAEAEGEGAALLRALVNLLDNAVRFAPPGSAITVALAFLAPPPPPPPPPRAPASIRCACRTCSRNMPPAPARGAVRAWALPMSAR